MERTQHELYDSYLNSQEHSSTSEMKIWVT